jgi:hypothetical protein
MARKHRRGKRRGLQFVHNIRPAIALSDSPKRSAVPLMTAGMLIVVLALMFVLGQ